MSEIQLGDVEARWWGSEPADAEVGILAVHGRGQGAGDMVRLLERLPEGLPSVAALVPQAAGGTWYPERFLSPLEDNREALGRALDTAVRGLDALAEAGLSRERVVVVGFSQGACLLSTLLLQEPAAAGLAGAALLAGGFVGPRQMPAPTGGSALDGLPVRLSIAAEDAWVPLFRVEETAAALTQVGADVRLVVRDGDEHAVDDAQVESVAELVRRVVAI